MCALNPAVQFVACLPLLTVCLSAKQCRGELLRLVPDDMHDDMDVCRALPDAAKLRAGPQGSGVSVQDLKAYQRAHRLERLPTPSEGLSYLFAASPQGLGSGVQDLKAYQRAHCLERLPTPLEGLSYLFAAGNLLAGPHFELSDYLAFVERRGPWDPSAPRPPPSAAWVGTVRMAKALACLGIYLWLGQLLPIAVVQVSV